MASRTPLFDDLRGVTQQLVVAAVSDACDMMNDMDIDEGGADCSIQAVKEQSSVMLRLLLDPEDGNVVLPMHLYNAMNEYIEQKVGFKVIR